MLNPSDDSKPLEIQINEAISNSPHVNSKSLKLEAHQGHVSLKGHVKSFYQKQMAQEALRGIDGILQIQNDLEVIWQTDPIASDS